MWVDTRNSTASTCGRSEVMKKSKEKSGKKSQGYRFLIPQSQCPPKSTQQPNAQKAHCSLRQIVSVTCDLLGPGGGSAGAGATRKGNRS